LTIAALALPMVAVATAAGATENQPTGGSALWRGEEPIIFGHRGATGYRPEHTIASYELAVQHGAEYIEPDLVLTKDGVLVARHENEIGDTTDVADRPEFADRHTTKVIDGVEETGWFTEDFTLAELKTLRVYERIPDQRPNNTLYDGRYEILTLQEIVDFAKRASREYRRPVGVIPEVKHPTYYESIGLPFEPPLVELIKRNGYNGPDGRMVIQSNEPTILRRLNKQVNTQLMQSLLNAGSPYDTVASGEGPTYDEMATADGLREIATYADWLTAQKNRFIPRVDGALGEPTTLAEDARNAGLAVSIYTFRNENRYLPPALRIGSDPNAYGDAWAEYEAFFELGIDALFSDNPDTALIARREFFGS
jgi:glycerophosphoryl diester phosphodiesterase